MLRGPGTPGLSRTWRNRKWLVSATAGWMGQAGPTCPALPARSPRVPPPWMGLAQESFPGGKQRLAGGWGDFS